MSDPKLGVFVCECGCRISSYLDVARLEKEIGGLSKVALARRLRYACSPDGLAAIQADISRHSLDRVLVAGCTPRTLGPHLRAACEDAGLNGNLFELVDIREGCAWVHLGDAERATRKAADLIRMGVAGLALREPDQTVSAEVTRAALVIGGGLAGIAAALTLADAGVPVRLVEREAALGGMLRLVHTLSPDGEDASEFLAQRAEALSRHPHIDVLLGSEVVEMSGSPGRYALRIAGVDGKHNGSGPRSFNVGAIIVATGVREARPHGAYRYDGERVVTQIAFERELRAGVSGGQPGARMDDLVMILCAGQRDQTIPYCSGYCCLGALRQAMAVKATHPGARVTIIFRDLYLLNDELVEEIVIEARRAGVEFVRYAPESPPLVTDDAVEVFDQLTGMVRRLPYDRVVLAAPLAPQTDAGVVAHRLNITQDENGFFPEVRARLRPENQAGRGIYVCGGAHFSTHWREAEFQAVNAAFKALRHLCSGVLSSRAAVAFVREELCTGCANCVETCPSGAISMQVQPGILDRAVVDPLLCGGCGNCVVECPSKAISLPVGSDAEVFAQIEAALASPRADDGQMRVLIFGCEWSGHAAAELAGARRLAYPVEVLPIRLPCSARFDPTHALWAFLNGADGVFVGVCPPGECHYGDGNRCAQERIDTLREQLAATGFDARRLRLEWITPDDPDDFVDRITAFTNMISHLKPSLVQSE